MQTSEIWLYWQRVVRSVICYMQLKVNDGESVFSDTDLELHHIQTRPIFTLLIVVCLDSIKT